MTLRVPVQPALLLWACERNQREVEDYAAQVPKLAAWVAGDELPTLKQLEVFAKRTATPLPLLLLPEPPVERLPIHDFRTLAGAAPRRPSPELLDTIRDCQTRQDWFRSFARLMGQDRLEFVGSARLDQKPAVVAARIRRELRFEVSDRKSLGSWEKALASLIERTEERGVLVMRSGIVASNTSRTLDPEEFRGFSLVDELALAPVVFINGADSKAAQIFTLAHELAHIWLGQGGVSDERLDRFDTDATEAWCNAVAAEVLVPLDDLAREAPAKPSLEDDVPGLARSFKVSTMVILRRLLDLGRISRAQFSKAFAAQLARFRETKPVSAGGDFYRTLPARVSPRFARAVVISTLEGQTLYDEAFRMLGIRKTKTFDGLAVALGVA